MAESKDVDELIRRYTQYSVNDHAGSSASRGSGDAKHSSPGAEARQKSSSNYDYKMQDAQDEEEEEEEEEEEDEEVKSQFDIFWLFRKMRLLESNHQNIQMTNNAIS